MDSLNVLLAPPPTVAAARRALERDLKRLLNQFTRPNRAMVDAQ
ncbi:MAG: hypothetical protein ACJ8DY_17630 [Xanthobacteraceae bacterium]